MISLFKVFSKDKSFALPIIGNEFLNRKGLHLFRIRLSDIFLCLRRIQISGFKKPAEFKVFQRDGLLIIPNFLPEKEFKLLVEEAKKTISSADETTPIEGYGENGFGNKHKFDWGFDRYDGDTLNRFYDIKKEHVHIEKFVNNKRLKKLTSFCAGTYHDVRKYYLYKLLHGYDTENSDSQKLIHRDTFHSAIKLWFFLEDVAEKDGPFAYAAGTNNMTDSRLQWEKKQSIIASSKNKGGAFRITAEELKESEGAEIQYYPLKANTLVIADIRGFHCRGPALANQQRLSIYANIRPAPFLLAFHAGKLQSLWGKIKGKS